MEFSDLVIPLLALQLSAIVWPVLAVRRLRRCAATRREQWFWGAWTLAFGAPGYLALRASGSFNRTPQARAPSVVRRSLFADARACGVRLNDAFASSAFAGLTRCGLAPGHAALVAKELRLAAGVAVLASVAFLCIVARLMNVAGFGWMQPFVETRISVPVPFLRDGFQGPFTVITLLMAVGLAVLQTSSESRGGAWLFLLHRPVSRRAILLSKLTVGLSVLLVCSALPIVVYALWAAKPGTHPSPFEWSMTNETWRQWWSMTPPYLGTLLTLLRPARWFGTRLLPCVDGCSRIVRRVVVADVARVRVCQSDRHCVRRESVVDRERTGVFLMRLRLRPNRLTARRRHARFGAGLLNARAYGVRLNEVAELNTL